jgi:hypothetical protein
MANYNKSTNFTAKDTLPTGNAGKIIKGTEIDTELNAVANAISSKADSNSPAFTGTPTTTTAIAGTSNNQIASTAFIQAAINVLLPTGIVCMWSGAISSIPTGWFLCDGQNSTPDLRGKFIIGAGDTAASVTAKAGASVTGSISGTTLTVSAVEAGGVLAVGDIVSHPSILNTATITGLGTGTGGTGTYTLTYTGSESSFTGSISGTTMTVTAITSGSIVVGQIIAGTDVTANTIVSSQISGTQGGIGTYTVSISQTRTSRALTGTYTLASTTISILSTTMTVTAVASGTLSIGQFLTGAGVSFSTSITALGTGSGNTGTYTLSFAQYFASTTVTASAGTVTVGATGGSKDSSVVSHTHTATVAETPHAHTYAGWSTFFDGGTAPGGNAVARGNLTQTTATATTGISVTNAPTGVSGTNANLPPYYALAYIMKA